MKIGRYEWGYWFLMIALIAALLPIAWIIKKLPDWLSMALFVILFWGVETLYSTWYLKLTCKFHLHQWIEQHGFTYRIKSGLFSSAHIQGMYHNRPLHIKLEHAMKSQDSSITCKVENERNIFASLSKRGLFGQSSHRRVQEDEDDFEQVFRVDSSAPEIFSGDYLRNQLVEIEDAWDVIDFMTLKRHTVTLTYRGMLTNTKKLEGALEAVALVADAVDAKGFTKYI